MHNLVRDVLGASSSKKLPRSYTILYNNQANSLAPMPLAGGYQSTDLALVCAYANNATGANGGLGLPAGWTRLAFRNTLSGSICIDYVSPIGSVTSWTSSSNTTAGNAAVALTILRPVNFSLSSFTLGGAVSANTANATVFAGSIDPNPITPPNANTYAFVMFNPQSLQAPVGITPPTGYTEIYDYYVDFNVRRGMQLSYQVRTDNAVIDPPSFSAPVTDGVAYTFCIRTEELRGVLSPGSQVVDAPWGGQVVQTTTAFTVLDEVGGSYAISISGGNAPQYSINGGAWTSSPGTVSGGSTVHVRQTSVTGTAASIVDSVATLTVGSSTATYNLRTRRIVVCYNGPAINTFPSYTMTVVSGMPALAVVATGGGGGGGSGNISHRGGGGGGGAMSQTPALAVSAGDVLTITAGTGGSFAPGNPSNIVRSAVTIFAAAGGTQGGPGAAVPRAPGPGGTAAASIGTTRFSGGSGGFGNTNPNTTFAHGGGGGGAGGYSGAGGAGANGAQQPGPLVPATLLGTPGTGGAGGGGRAGGSGGGTGVSGVGVDGPNQGGEGSPDIYAGAAGVTGGGNSGGGAVGGASAVNPGGTGVIRVTW